jgi:hypothetical protein
MRVFENEYGVNFPLDQSKKRPGEYYFDPATLVAFIQSGKYDLGKVRVDAHYGVSISISKRKKKEKQDRGDE